MTIEHDDDEISDGPETAELSAEDEALITDDDEAEGSPYDAEDFDGTQDATEVDDAP